MAATRRDRRLRDVQSRFGPAGGRRGAVPAPYVTDDPGDLECRGPHRVCRVSARFADAMQNLRSRRARRRVDQAGRRRRRAVPRHVPRHAADGGARRRGRADAKGSAGSKRAVVRLEPTETDRRVPHVGWNEVTPWVDSPLFDGDTARPPISTSCTRYHVVCATHRRGARDDALLRRLRVGGATRPGVRRAVPSREEPALGPAPPATISWRSDMLQAPSDSRRCCTRTSGS